MQNDMDNIILQEISNKYPVSIERVEQITNEIFRCVGNKKIYFARITNYKTFEEQLEEVKWLHYLMEQGVGVAAMVRSINGEFVEVGHFPKEKLIVLFEAAKGIHLPRSKWDARVFKRLGKQIGKFHRITSQYELENEIKYIYDWNKSEEYDFLKYIPIKETAIREIALRTLRAVKEIPINRGTYGLLHADVWLENVLVDDHQEITFIDFQDAEKHYYLYDLVVPIYSAVEFSFPGNDNIQEYTQSIAEALFQGYLEEFSIPLEMMSTLPALFKLKEIFEYNVMHMYWDAEKLTEEEVRILNHYRLRLENNHAPINLDYERLVTIVKNNQAFKYNP